MLLISISKMVLNCSFPVVIKLNDYNVDALLVGWLHISKGTGHQRRL